MEISIFIKGFMIGLVVAAPLGPIGIISLQRTLSEGYLPGLFSGLGISTADAIYGALATFGVTAISSFLISQQLWLKIIGGIVYKKTNQISTLLLIGGVFLGSAIWWVFLSGMASRLKTPFTESFIKKINYISGVLIAGFGLVMVGSALFSR